MPSRVVVVAHRDHHRLLSTFVDVLVDAQLEAVLWDDAEFAARRSQAVDAYVFAIWDSPFAALAHKVVPVNFHHNGFTGGFHKRMALLFPIDDVVDRERNTRKMQKRLEEAKEHCAQRVGVAADLEGTVRGVVLADRWIQAFETYEAQRPRAPRADVLHLEVQLALGLVFFLIRCYDSWIHQLDLTPVPAPLRPRSGLPTPPRTHEPPHEAARAARHPAASESPARTTVPPPPTRDLPASDFIAYSEPVARHFASDLPPPMRTAAPDPSHRQALLRQLEAAEQEASAAEGRVAAREDLVQRTPVTAPERPARERELDAATRQRRAALTRISALKRQIDSS